MTFDGRAPGTPAAAWSADPRFRDLPALALRRTGRTVVVAAHPDDETLGAGGILAELADAGLPGRGRDRLRRRRLPPRLPDARRRGAGGSPVGGGGRGGARPVAGLADHDARAPGRRPARGPRRDRGRPAGAARPTAPRSTSSSRRGAATATGTTGSSARSARRWPTSSAARLLEYPIWLWHWATPDDPRVPWDRLRVVELADRSVVRKHRAVAAHDTQVAPLSSDPTRCADAAPGVPADVRPGRRGRRRPGACRGPRSPGEFFDATYGRHDDPWGYADRWYEERKRALTMAVLPDRRYRDVLEVGCSIGVLTAELAQRADHLLALDVSRRGRARPGARRRRCRRCTCRSPTWPTGRPRRLVRPRGPVRGRLLLRPPDARPGAAPTCVPASPPAAPSWSATGATRSTRTR